MRRFLAISCLLLSCALAVQDSSAQTGSPQQTVYDAGPPPTEQIAIDSTLSPAPALYAVSSTRFDGSDYQVRQAAIDTTTTPQQPEGPSASAHKPAQDDHPVRPRGTLAHGPKHELPALPDRLPALHLSQAWHIPHRPWQLHRITHY